MHTTGNAAHTLRPGILDIYVITHRNSVFIDLFPLVILVKNPVIQGSAAAV
jgi:hypothetical protein